MARVTNSPASRARRKKVLKAAKGYFGAKSKLYRYATEAVKHGLQYAYRDRRVKKRTWRALWAVRLNAAVRAEGLTYSRFIEGLKAANVAMDRKSMSEFAINDPEGFKRIVATAREGLQAKADGKVRRRGLAEGADDLVKIEGIGPKIADLLAKSGIASFAQLAATPQTRLKDVLAGGGARFRLADPGTWPEQAALAANGDWDGLKALQARLNAGKA